MKKDEKKMPRVKFPKFKFTVIEVVEVLTGG